MYPLSSRPFFSIIPFHLSMLLPLPSFVFPFSLFFMFSPDSDHLNCAKAACQSHVLLSVAREAGSFWLRSQPLHIYMHILSHSWKTFSFVSNLLINPGFWEFFQAIFGEDLEFPSKFLSARVFTNNDNLFVAMPFIKRENNLPDSLTFGDFLLQKPKLDWNPPCK